MREPKIIPVEVQVTLSKILNVPVYDYTEPLTYTDTDGEFCDDTDYSTCDLKVAVEDTVQLPQDIFSDWDLEDYSVCMV